MNVKKALSKIQKQIRSQNQLVNFLWVRLFRNISLNKIVYFCNKTGKIVLSNYIPPAIIMCNDRDLPWISKMLK